MQARTHNVEIASTRNVLEKPSAVALADRCRPIHVEDRVRINIVVTRTDDSGLVDTESNAKCKVYPGAVA